MSVKNSPTEVLKGLQSRSGKDIFSCIFDEIEENPINSLYLYAGLGRQNGLIDTLGNIIIPFEFLNIILLSSRYCKAVKSLPDEYYIFEIVPKNSRLIAGPFTLLGDVDYTGILPVYSGNKAALFSLNSKKLITNFLFNELKHEGRNRYLAKKNHKYFMIDTLGNKVWKYEYDKCQFTHQIQAYIVGRNGKESIINLDESQETPDSIKSIQYRGNLLKYPYIYQSTSDKWGYLNHNFEPVKGETYNYTEIPGRKTYPQKNIPLPYKYEIVKHKEGYTLVDSLKQQVPNFIFDSIYWDKAINKCVVIKQKKYGLYSLTSKLPQLYKEVVYDSISLIYYFPQNVILCKKGEYWDLDLMGTEHKFNNVLSYQEYRSYNNLAHFTFKTIQGNLILFVVDRAKKKAENLKVYELNYQEIVESRVDNSLKVKKDGKYGLIKIPNDSTSVKEFLPCKYDMLITTQNNLAIGFIKKALFKIYFNISNGTYIIKP